MKNYLIALTMLATLAAPCTADTHGDATATQKDNVTATPRKDTTAVTKKQATPTKKKNAATTAATAAKQTAAKAAGHDKTEDKEGLEAFSDTTSAPVDSASAYAAGQAQNRSYSVTVSEDDARNMFGTLSDAMNDMLGVAMVILIVFVFSPVAILALLFYFIYKSRKQKLKLAEIAMQNGQSMPDGLLKPTVMPDEQMWRKGIKNIFLGIGLMFLFGFMGFERGIGIGFLVLFYGAGQAVIARTSASRNGRNDDRRDATPKRACTDDRPNEDTPRTDGTQGNNDIPTA